MATGGCRSCDRVRGKFLQTNNLLSSDGHTNSGRTASTRLNLKEWTIPNQMSLALLVTVSGRVSLRGRNLEQTQRLFLSFTKVTFQSADSASHQRDIHLCCPALSLSAVRELICPSCCRSVCLVTRSVSVASDRCAGGGRRSEWQEDSKPSES